MKKNNQKGFTLVELMIAAAVGVIVLGAIVTFFQSQQRTYIAQEEVAETQQELRAALEIATREIRNAGHDLDPANSAGAGFIAAGPYQVQFSMDLTDADPPVTNAPDGDILDPNENVTYGFSAANDPDGNGIANAGAADLGRDSGAGLQALSSNIQAIGFAYAYDSGTDGQLETYTDGTGNNHIRWDVPDGAGLWINLDTDNNGTIDEDDAAPVGVGQANATQLGQIRAVRMWILSRASRPDFKFSDTATTYKVGANVVPAPVPNTDESHYRRRLLSVNIRCRNMGLQ